MYLKSSILLPINEILHKALFLSTVIPKSILVKNYCFQHILGRGKMNPRFEEILILSHEVPWIYVSKSYVYEPKLSCESWTQVITVVGNDREKDKGKRERMRITKRVISYLSTRNCLQKEICTQ